MRFIPFLLLTLAAPTADAQYDLINRTVIRQDSSFLFRDERNIIAITGKNSGKWQLTAANAEITPTDSPHVFIVETRERGTATLRLARNGAQVLTKLFYIAEEPDPIARLGVLRKDTASITEILANNRIIIVVPGCDCSRNFRVTRFNVYLTTDQLSEAKKKIAADGNSLSEEMTSAIRQLKHGDKVAFKEIVVLGRDSRARSMPGPTIIIR